jgi:hypothetical protein
MEPAAGFIVALNLRNQECVHPVIQELHAIDKLLPCETRIVAQDVSLLFQ